MTTGYIKTEISNVKIDAYFVSGKIKNGTMTSHQGITYSGTFNDSEKLEGEMCTMIDQFGVTYRGKFVNGVFIEGEKIVNKIRETGKFTTLSLTEGTRMLSDMIQKGKFSYGYLISGEIIYSNGIIHRGIFSQDRLKDGEMIYPNGFYAKVSFNDENNLISCKIKYSCGLTELYDGQIPLICCEEKGESNTSLFIEFAYIFFKKFLNGQSLQQILEYDSIFPEVLTKEEQLGWQYIYNNLSLISC